MARIINNLYTDCNSTQQRIMHRLAEIGSGRMNGTSIRDEDELIEAGLVEGEHWSTLTITEKGRSLVEASKPEVGQAVTICHPSDCYPGTIVRVNKAGTVIHFTRDDYKRTDSNGQSESQDYIYIPRTDRKPERARLCSDGAFHMKGGKKGTPVAIGYRRAYQSPHI